MSLTNRVHPSTSCSARADGTARGTRNSVGHTGAPLVAALTSPPDTTRRARGQTVGGQCAIVLGMPLGGHLRVPCLETVGFACPIVGAKRARRELPGAITHTHAPNVPQVDGAAPPGDTCRRGRNVGRGHRSVVLRVPLQGELREARGEAIGHRDSTIRAEGAACSIGAIVGLGAPPLVRSARTDPPHGSTRTRRNLTRLEVSVALVVPLADKLGEAVYPVLRAGVRRKRLHAGLRGARMLAPAKQPTCRSTCLGATTTATLDRTTLPLQETATCR
jgi:hypothetical protein